MPPFSRCRRWLSGLLTRVHQTVGARLWVRPMATLLRGTGTYPVRSRRQLVAENALPRQQLLVLRRGVERPATTTTDRALLVLLAGRVRA